ncbi:BppU family phage baseplate upper protein [Vagococcus fluvialis]|uniref:BppU family phage baseplate upper protein n=1 Tax=Vagococcus fluvialis TaxID=2738 RepID=UPI003B21E541
MTNKVKWVGTLSTTERNHIGLIRVRQNNVNSEVLGFEIIDGAGEPYDLKNRKVLFCTYFDKFAPVEQYAEVIENGKIVYTMNQHDMQKPVRINFAYFKILDEKDNLVDTTQNFSYDIMTSIESKCMNSEPYIVRLEEVLDAFLQINTDAKKELEQIIIDFNQQVIEQQQNFDIWFESIREILESIDPGGVILNELVDFRYSKTFDKRFNRIKERGDFWDKEIESRGINPKNFGATGAGFISDSKSIQKAIDLAAKKGNGIIIENGTFVVDESLIIKEGLKFIKFFNSKLKVQSAKNNINVITDYINIDDEKDYVNGVSIIDAVIDMNGSQGSAGIKLKGSYYIINKAKIDNFKFSGNRGIRVLYGASRNIITHNEIEMPQIYDGYTDNQCISIMGKPYSQNAGLESNNTVQDGTLTCFRNEVAFNHLIGGVYGISLGQAYNNFIHHNFIRYSTARGIIVSPRSVQNIVKNNVILESGSTGIQVAFGSDFNDIDDNFIVKSVVKTLSESDLNGNFYGEAGIQVTKYCNYNLVRNNTVFSRWYYGIAISIAATNTDVTDNYVYGGILAGISLESDITVTTKQWPFGRPNFENPVNPNWATWANGNETSSINIKGNTVRKIAEKYITKSTAYNIHQIGGNSSFNNINIEDNISFDANEGPEFVYNANDPNLNKGISINRNTISSLTDSKVSISNRDLKIKSYEGNSWQKLTSKITKQDSFNIANVSTTDTIVLAENIVVGTLLGMEHNQNSKTFILAKNATLRHNASNILLKGKADVKATEDNQIIKLEYYDQIGKWIETFRSF